MHSCGTKNNFNILLIQPFIHVVESLAESIEEEKELAFFYLNTLEDFVDVIQTLDYAIVVLSVTDKVSLKNGIDFFKNFFNLIQTCKIRILVVSNFDQKEVKEAFKKLGCVEYLNANITSAQGLLFKINLQASSFKMSLKKGRLSKIFSLSDEEDYWVFESDRPSKKDKKYFSYAQGPDPNTGEWVEYADSSSAERLWQWRNNKTNHQDDKGSSSRGWIFSGDKPIYDKSKNKWEFLSDKPKMSYLFEDQIEKHGSVKKALWSAPDAFALEYRDSDGVENEGGGLAQEDQKSHDFAEAPSRLKRLIGASDIKNASPDLRGYLIKQKNRRQMKKKKDTTEAVLFDKDKPLSVMGFSIALSDRLKSTPSLSSVSNWIIRELSRMIHAEGCAIYGLKESTSNELKLFVSSSALFSDVHDAFINAQKSIGDNLSLFKKALQIDEGNQVTMYGILLDQSTNQVVGYIIAVRSRLLRDFIQEEIETFNHVVEIVNELFKNIFNVDLHMKKVA